MAALRINMLLLALTMPAPSKAAKIGCQVSVSEVELCCYVSDSGTTTTTTTAAFQNQYASAAKIEHVWDSYSRKPAENFTNLADVKQACDAQPKCAGFVKHKVHGYFWVETCGPSTHDRSTDLVEEVLYKMISAPGQVMKCECPRNLLLKPWREGNNPKFGDQMGVYSFHSQTDGKDPNDKSGHRPVYKLVGGSAYLYYRIGEVWSGWIISDNGFQSTYGKLRNSDDDLCPTTVSEVNWQGVDSTREQADVPHLDTSTNPPTFPAPWRELFEIKVLARVVHNSSSQPSPSKENPGGTCRFTSMCDTYPVIKHDFDQCCISAQAKRIEEWLPRYDDVYRLWALKKRTHECTTGAFKELSEQWEKANTLTTTSNLREVVTRVSTTVDPNAPLRGPWDNYPTQVPRLALASASQAVLPFVSVTFGLITLMV